MQNAPMGSSSTVTVYWRPGCPYCARLRRELRVIGLVTSEVNIWENSAAAAVVRAYTGGNETVPTVVIGDTGLINPSAVAVLDAVRAQDPDVIINDDMYLCAKRRRALQLAKWIAVSTAVIASFATDAVGRTGASWAIDGIGVMIYMGFRLAIRRATTDDTTTSTKRG